MSRQANWYFDYVSPYAYLQLECFHRLPADVDVTIKPVLFAGLLGYWDNMGPAEIPAKRRQTYRYCHWQAHKRGIPFKTPPRHPFNPLAVLRLSLALGSDIDAVRAISCSEEMKPWSVGGDYDRPIARRCAVESGVPTEWFGLRKYGSGWGLIKSTGELCDASRTDLREYLEGGEAPSDPMHARVGWVFMRTYLHMLWRLGLSPGKTKLVPGWLKRFTRDPFEDRLFRWGIDRTTRRYRCVTDSA